MQTKYILGVILIAVIVVAGSAYYFMSAPPSELEQHGGTLVIADMEEPTAIAPGSNEMQGIIKQNLMDTLCQYRTDSCYVDSLMPRLAESWETSSDGKVITLHLVQNATFHCGREFNATTAKWALDYAMETGFPFTAPWIPNMDRDNYPPWGHEYVDRWTVKVHFVAPIPYWLALEATTHTGTLLGSCPYHMEAAGYDHPQFGQYGVPGGVGVCGTGPYKFVEWVPGDHITMEANDNYFMGRPNIDKLIYRFIPDATIRALELETKGVDCIMGRMGCVTSQDIPRLETTEGIILSKTNGIANPWIQVGIYDLGIAANKSITYTPRWPMSDIRFRKALYQLFDWDNLVTMAAPHGTVKVIHSLLSCSFDASAHEQHLLEDILPAYNEAEAIATINALKAERPFNNFTRGNTLFILAYAGEQYKRLGEFIASKLIEIGIPAAIEQPTAGVRNEISYKGEFDLQLGINGKSVIDPAFALNDQFYASYPSKYIILPNGTRLYGTIYYPLVLGRIDELCGLVTSMVDSPERRTLLYELDDKITALFLAFTVGREVTYWAYWDYVKPGLVTNPLGQTTIANTMYKQVWGVDTYHPWLDLEKAPAR